MKTILSLVNFMAGLLALLIGLGNLLFIPHNPMAAVTGAVTMAVGATLVWLATEAMSRRTLVPLRGNPCAVRGMTVIQILLHSYPLMPWI